VIHHGRLLLIWYLAMTEWVLLSASGAMRLTLFTLLPTAWVAYVPARLVKEGSFELLVLMAVVPALREQMRTVRLARLRAKSKRDFLRQLLEGPPQDGAFYNAFRQVKPSRLGRWSEGKQGDDWKMTRSWRSIAALILALSAALAVQVAEAQRYTYSKGQPVFPAYEGWEENPDGSFNLLFGYMNDNWEQILDIPIGPDNSFSPGAADQGQPTHFLPRRNRFVFKVRVPSTFDVDDEIVWTLRANGQEHKAYGTRRQDYYIDNVVIMSETGALGAGTSSPEIRANKPPTITLEGADTLTARVGTPLTLAAHVVDDGQPPAEGFRGATDPEEGTTARKLLERALVQTRGSTVAKAVGLHFTWFPYEGPDGVILEENVSFDPPQTKPWEDTRPFANSPWAPYWVPPGLRKPSELPSDGRWTSTVTFSKPGTYVLRGRADDGGLYSDVEVTVRVAP